MRYHACSLLFMLIYCTFFTPSASALSDAQYKQMIANSQEFSESEKNLNAAWKALQKVSPASDMKRYKEDQRWWIKIGRDKFVNAFTDNSDQADATKIYSELNNERAILITELVKQHKNPAYLPIFTGSFGLMNERDGETRISLYKFFPEKLKTGITVALVGLDEDIPKPVLNLIEQSISGKYATPTVTIKGRLQNIAWYDSKSLTIESNQK